jgi:UDP-N-acetylglucosamine 4,6-dehydratase
VFENKIICVTGGTGSFGKAFIRRILKDRPKKVIVFSRDEFKQSEMAKEFPECRYMLGDVRDKDRLKQVFANVDYVVHAAALKQVPALEYNPTEAIKTNVDGAKNIVEAAMECGVEKVVALSTDKAVNPVNLYGATKLCAEKIFTAANAFNKTKFSSVRYGNVIGSRGSVIPFFQSLKKKGAKVYPITDFEMTRFWLTLDQAVQLVLDAFVHMDGGEVFVPRIPSMKITDMATAVDPDCELEEVGIRPGEKLHETLVSEDCANVYHIIDQGLGNKGKFKASPGYASDTNDQWMSIDQLREILND